MVLGQYVVDPVLVGRGAADVIVERLVLVRLAAMGRRKAQQLRDLVLVGVVLDHAFFQHLPELVPEHGEVVRRIAGHFRQHVQHSARQRRAHRGEVRVLLQQFARHVEGQVRRVDDAAHEPQVQRQELLGVVHDEDALHVKLEPARRVAVPEVERRRARDVQQARVVALALDTVVAPGQRIREVV